MRSIIRSSVLKSDVSERSSCRFRVLVIRKPLQPVLDSRTRTDLFVQHTALCSLHMLLCSLHRVHSVYCLSKLITPGYWFISRFFIIRHIHNHTSIISSEIQVELKKNTAFTWGKGGEKNYPQTMLLGEYSVRTGKTPQCMCNTKAHTRQSHRGSESGPASSHLIPQPLIRRWSDPLDQASGSKRTEANGRGGGGGGQCL